MKNGTQLSNVNLHTHITYTTKVICKAFVDQTSPFCLGLIIAFNSLLISHPNKLAEVAHHKELETPTNKFFMYISFRSYLP